MSERSLQHLVIVTGLSGSGKSFVLSTLEDLGFYCCDNLPVGLIEPLLGELGLEEGKERIAFGVDVRTHGFAERFPQWYRDRLKHDYPQSVMIFLDATDEVLARRFSETRRPHPFGAERSLLDAIRAERTSLLEVKSLANMVLDTSQFSVHELKREITRRFDLSGTEEAMLVTVESFGFKYGPPVNLDLLFDVRSLPNPHFIDSLRPKTGLDPEVINYFAEEPEYEGFVEHLTGFLEYALPGYRREMKSYLTIGIGCTGGRHRSVAVAQRLGDDLSRAGYLVEVVHRDIQR